ncbi:alpha/beta fold hydrolase [Rhodococcus sp. NPDC056516]|uniref:alpha/beta hydrolase n=1 Tax=Rhodococcus sp. NPDC056516 TaxID=3345847 RepID=UPI0036717192
MNRRTMFAGAAALAAAAAASAPATAGTGISSASPTRPDYLLVHGGSHGGWCWRKLAPMLQRGENRVITPTITGVGDRSHLLHAQLSYDDAVNDIIRTIEAEELTDFVLVGHSIGGAYITSVADRMREKIRRLVYLDAVVIENGETVLSTMPLGSQEVLRTLVAATGGHAVPAPTDPTMFGLTDRNDIEWAKRQLTAHPWSTWRDTVTLAGPAGAGLPRHYIDFTEPAFTDIQASKQRVLNNSREWQLDRINTGHDGMISAPRAVAKQILSYDR